MLRTVALAAVSMFATTGSASAWIAPTMNMPSSIESGATTQASFTVTGPSEGMSIPETTGVNIGGNGLVTMGQGPLQELRVISELRLGAMSGTHADKVACTVTPPNGIDCALATGFAGPATVAFSFVAPKAAGTSSIVGRQLGGLLGSFSYSAGGPSSLTIAKGTGSFPTKLWLGETAPVTFTITNSGAGAARFVLVGHRPSSFGPGLEPRGFNHIAAIPDARCVKWSDEMCMIDTIGVGETVTVNGVFHADSEYYDTTGGMDVALLHAKADLNQDPIPPGAMVPPAGLQWFSPFRLSGVEVAARPATAVLPMFHTNSVTDFLRSGDAVTVQCRHACSATARFDVPAAVQKALRLKTTTIASGVGRSQDSGTLAFRVTTSKATLTALRRYRGAIGVTRTVVITPTGGATVRGTHTLAPERTISVFNPPPARIAAVRKGGVVIRYQCPGKCTSTGKVTVSRLVQRQLGLASPTLGTAKGIGRRAGEQQLVVRLFPSVVQRLRSQRMPVAVSVLMRVEMRARDNDDLLVTRSLRLVP